MMMARPNWAAVCGTTVWSAAPSRTCRCQSSGRVRVRVWVVMLCIFSNDAGVAALALGLRLIRRQIVPQRLRTALRDRPGAAVGVHPRFSDFLDGGAFAVGAHFHGDLQVLHIRWQGAH